MLFRQYFQLELACVFPILSVVSWCCFANTLSSNLLLFRQYFQL
jgi:hypothetical protein